MNNRFKEAYDDINVPDSLHSRLMDIPAKKAAAKSVWVRAAAIMAAVFVLFFSADIIGYAVTGEGIVERVHKAFSDDKSITKVEINGRPADSFEISSDGKTVIINDDIYAGVLIDTDGNANDIAISIFSEPVLSAESQNGRVYLLIGSAGKMKIDITDDLQDGEAKGSFIVDDKEYNYKVTEQDEVFEVEYE
ncbi:hypothetical protein [Ruminococcus sp. NK3A76]|uniref:hypothetical protein n=1 Tax=Ruminococcus sp. NK3A76 TaxID=877411 RepID=UPI00048D9326|nr:hypothetical protein [Ruminococcus sp. NK3A76]